MKMHQIAVITNLDRFANDPGVNEDMKTYLGKTVTIVGEDDSGQYFHILEDGGGFFWDPRWFKTTDGKIPIPLKPSHKTPTTSKTRLKDLMAELRKGAKQHATATTYCHYGLISHTERGYELKTQFKDVCHFRIANHALGGEVVALLDFAGLPRERMKSRYKTWLRYSDFIINRSYVKDAFIPTRMSDYVRNGVQVNLDATCTHVMTGLNALRMGREKHTIILPKFELLVNNGFDEGVAFLLSASFQTNASGRYVASVDTGHSVITPSASPELLIKVAAGTFKFPKGEPYRKVQAPWAVFKSISDEKSKETWGGFLTKTAAAIGGRVGSYWGVDRHKPLHEDQFLALASEFQSLVDEEKKK